MGDLSIVARLRQVGHGRLCRRVCILVRRIFLPATKLVVSLCSRGGPGAFYTRSNVFFALSETKGSAIGGMASAAGMVKYQEMF